MNYEVRINASTKTDPVAEMFDWTEEHNMKCEYNVLHSESTFGRPLISGFVFSFENEDDAAAFKLRWV